MAQNLSIMKKWKKEQLNYFKEYLSTFDEGSREYNLILKGIKKLEKF
jgi:hypothetical protein